jgi:hypothetical protein
MWRFSGPIFSFQESKEPTWTAGKNWCALLDSPVVTPRGLAPSRLHLEGLAGAQVSQGLFGRKGELDPPAPEDGSVGRRACVQGKYSTFRLDRRIRTIHGNSRKSYILRGRSAQGQSSVDWNELLHNVTLSFRGKWLPLA